MTNYDSKYLKYKNKYINLKNEYNGGGSKDIIILYDDTNPILNDLFQTIKNGYTKHYGSNENIKKKYYIDDSINLKKELNCLLNIYTYILGDNKIESEFRFKFDNLNNLINGGSSRMQILLKPFNKALKKYKESSKIELKDTNKKYIITNYNCDSLKLQLDQILEYINKNEILNNDARITSTKALLEIVKLYQNKGEVDDIRYQSPRIGKFFTLSNTETIVIPSGITADIKLIDESYGGGEPSSDEKEKETKSEDNKEVKKYNKKDKEQETKTKLNNYVQEEKSEFSLNLNISSLKFNNLNNMIHLRFTKNILPTRKNPLIEVINIFNK
jgi:hypothetical protein